DKIQDSENKDKSKQEIETSEEIKQLQSEKAEVGEIRSGINLQVHSHIDYQSDNSSHKNHYNYQRIESKQNWDLITRSENIMTSIEILNLIMHHRFHNIKLYVPKHDVYCRDASIIKDSQHYYIKNFPIDINCTIFSYTTLHICSEKEKGKAIYLILYEYYTPLQANNYAHVDGDDIKNNDTFDCHQVIIQRKSGIFVVILEDALWNKYIYDPKQHIPGRNINKEIIDEIRGKVSFVFIMDGFDEIYDFYHKHQMKNIFMAVFI
ncbi:hypothetical protein RFI_40059, partial [Reticulomyxa filosa]